jgi:hypothetical protein
MSSSNSLSILVVMSIKDGKSIINKKKKKCSQEMKPHTSWLRDWTTNEVNL